MANNYGRIPFLGLGTTTTTTPVGTLNSGSSLMNRAGNRFSAFASSPKNMMMVGLILVLVLFVVLVVYNRTVGDKVRTGWEKIKTILREKGVISVELDPGNDGTSAIKATLNPEPSVILPPLTATLLPEPVTVPKPADVPPNDGISVSATDRPSGMPRSNLSNLSSSIFRTDNTRSESILGDNEVFNISKNIYTFNDAAAVCAAAGAELANYDQVKEAYEKGADWCNYGWIKGQMAVYPTQKTTWEKLQKGSPEFRNACGQPGVNGGYFDNPELQFGVNCYGTKPGKKASDEILDSQVALPQSPAELEFEKQVQRFRDQMDASTVLPFHKGRWNE